MGGRMGVVIGPNRFGMVTRELLTDLSRLGGKVAGDLERASKIEAPVDTGNLASLTYALKLGRFSFVVRSDAEYAAAVHEGSDHGTYVIPSNPYMNRGMAMVLPKADAAARMLAAKYGGSAR